MIEVILNKDVDKIGKSGAVLKVKEGFARNFLLPKGLAVIMTAGNLKVLEQGKAKRAEELAKAKQQCEALKTRLAGISLTISALAQEDEKLFGSIAAHDICVALKEEGLELDKTLIQLEEPIKALGIYEIPVKLHPEVLGKLKVWVVKK